MAYRDKEGGRHEGVDRLFRDLFPDKNNSSVTEREDAIILRSAVFKLFNAYFGIFFIAFAANRIPDAPWLKCPAWQVCIWICMQYLHVLCMYTSR
jgi:threonine/homoserine/homoserine lactone efflux protein